ncbi:MAG TPA: choice-of-anchor Q domain-containing protein [Armatimonadota bacterium]|jgi:hypothetical protein
MLMQRMAAAALLAAAILAPAAAETYTVDTSADTAAVDPAVGPKDAAGHISLRSAIQAANLKAGADTIDLLTATTYQLTLGPADSAIQALSGAAGDLDITDSLTLNGNGAKVDAHGIDRAFNIERASAPLSVTINDLTVVGGHAQGFLACGGGINVRAAEVSLNRCTVANNSADGNGGGIAVNGIFDPTAIAGALTLNDCMVTGNAAPNGANILAASSVVTVNGSTVAYGTASGDFGGAGIALLGDAALSQLTNVTVSDNSAIAGAGGGIATFGDGSGTLRYSTVAGNKAALGGGVQQSTAKIILNGSLVAGNAAGTGPDLLGGYVSDGYNLVGDRAGAIIPPATGDLFGGVSVGIIDPLLGPLQANGGPVLTRALLVGSPAIDAGSPLNYPPLDARHFRRPQDGDKNGTPRADIGAFELVFPYTAADAARALSLAGGLLNSTPADIPRLDLTLPDRIDVADAIVIARKVTGLNPNP